MKINTSAASAFAVLAFAGTCSLAAAHTALAQSPSEKDNPFAIHTAIGAHETRSPEDIEAGALREKQANYAFAAGEKSLAAGHALEAIDKYQQVIAVGTTARLRPLVYEHLGDAYGAIGRYPEAVAAYDKLWTRSHPEDPPLFSVSGTFRAAAFVKYAMLLKRTGRYTEALTAYRSALGDSDMIVRYESQLMAKYQLEVNASDVDTTNSILPANLLWGRR